MMDTKLNTLLRVQEEGSFTRAAEVLSLTQPAVSKHIRLYFGMFRQIYDWTVLYL